MIEFSGTMIFLGTCCQLEDDEVQVGRRCSGLLSTSTSLSSRLLES